MYIFLTFFQNIITFTGCNIILSQTILGAIDFFTLSFRFYYIIFRFTRYKLRLFTTPGFLIVYAIKRTSQTDFNEQGLILKIKIYARTWLFRIFNKRSLFSKKILSKNDVSSRIVYA